MCVANIGISSHSNLTLDMENIREPLSACYRVINENSLFTAAPKNQILVKHPVEGVVSSQDGLGADGEGWHTEVARAWGCNPRKGRDQILPSGNLGIPSLAIRPNPS